ncbi:hypothetical protein RND71_003983 [Anisodus tanguticus]|uniref:Protein kinase domain-containing protein n=1 Tax=Anisodus tanguticus TaxID=243964 RepID=A0AAE1SYV2_9SOLA|nr:hypothetical protein RND71_003983 [Anisodus tanguticus]
MTSNLTNFPSNILVWFILLFCFRSTFANTEFDFATLTLSSLKLLGDAHLGNNTVMLTRDLAVPNSGAGKVLYSKPIRFRQPGFDFPASFSTFFSFSVTNLNPSSIGGGLAFVLTPGDELVGDAGGYMGILDAKRTQIGTMAVEFDTLMDVEFKDINGNHVGLDLNSMVSTQVGDLESIGVDLKSGDLVNSWIEYSGSNGQMNVFVSYSNLKPKEPFLSVTINIAEYVNDFMFVGFSGSTQGSTEIHNIEWWSFSSSFDASPKSVVGAAAEPPPPPTASLMNPMADSVMLPPPSMAPSESNGTTSVLQEKSSGRCHSNFCTQGPGAVVGVVTAGAFFLAFATVVLIWLYSKKFKRVKNSEIMASDIIKMPKEFSYKELKLATKGFNSTRIIGHGAFGTVYKGILSDTGGIVAVKRCSHNGQGKAEFLSELSIIGTLRHRNLVRLQGWCHEKGEILLVYDLMPNGSLDKALFESRMVLPWSHRRKILLGVASALAYLHQECENQVIHRDIKSNSDSDLNGLITLSPSSSENSFTCGGNGMDFV